MSIASPVQPRVRSPRLIREFDRATRTGSIMAEGDNGAPLVIALKLPPNATPLEFLQAVYRLESIPLGMRLDAAKNAAMYTHPRMVAVAAINPGGEQFMISGGLPALPGSTTVMPRGKVTIEGEVIKPSPKPDKKPVKQPKQDETVE